MSFAYLLNTPPTSFTSLHDPFDMPASSKSSPSVSTSTSTTNSSSSSSKSRENGKNKRRNPPLSPSPSFYLPSAQAVRRPLSPSPSLPIPNRSQEAYSPTSHGRHGQIYRPLTPRSPSSPTRARSPASVPPPPPRRPSVTGATMDYSLSMAEILALSARPCSPYSPYPPNDPQYTLAVHYEPLAGMPFSKVQLEPPPPRPNSPIPNAIGPIGPAGEHVRIWTPQPRRFPVSPPGHSQRPKPTTRRSFSSPPARPSLSRSVTAPGTSAPPTTSPRETYEGRGFGQHSRLPSTDSITFFPLLDSDNDPPDQQSVTGEDEHPDPQPTAGGSGGGEGQAKQSFFTTLRNLTWRTAPRSAPRRSDKKRARDQVETSIPSAPSAPISRPQSPPLDYTQAQRQAITLLADRPGTTRVSPERRYKSPATTGLTLARTISLGRAEFEMGDRGPDISPAPLTGVDSTDKAPWSDTMAESTHSV